MAYGEVATQPFQLLAFFLTLQGLIVEKQRCPDKKRGKKFCNANKQKTLN